MNELNGYDVEDLRIGMSASFSKTITEADVVLFAGVSGGEQRDAHQRGIRCRHAVRWAHRPRHADRERDFCGHCEQAVRSGNDLPGPEPAFQGARAPVRPGQTVHATVTVTQIVPGRLTPTGLGTTVEQGKRTLEIDGRLFLLEMPLRADFALINARRADHIGNLAYGLTARNFNPLMAMAADKVIAESQEIVPVGVIAPDDVMTPAILVDHLIVKERIDE